MSLKVHIQTFGCQMNVHDSERMLRLLEREGGTHTPVPGEADLVVVNTCSVREKAYQKVRSAVGSLGRFAGRGRSRPRPIIAVAGCVARQEGGSWLELCPHVDIVLGPDAIHRLPLHVRAVMDGSPPVVDVEFDGRGEFVDASPVPGERGSGPTAFLTVMKGCSLKCTFCIVPSVRGPMRHRPSLEILAEAERLVASGAREIMLLGQTVNAWQEQAPGDGGAVRDFAWLLVRLDGTPGLGRVRYTSPHPRFVTPSLIEAHARLGTLCEHVHLPVQSGSDRILKRMGRGHGRESFLGVAGSLRAARPGLTISTDLIVGFPGETDEDFAETLDLVERMRFDTFFSFMYSPRPGTAAARWEDDVPAATKHERLLALHALGDRISAENWSGDLGRKLEVLVEGGSRAGDGQLTGRTRTNRIVNFDPGHAGPGLAGRIVDVEITEVMPHCLKGRAV